MKDVAQLGLRSLVIEPSQPCDTRLYSEDCAAIGEVKSLNSLALEKFMLIDRITCFQGLTNLKSLSLDLLWSHEKGRVATLVFDKPHVTDTERQF